MFPQLLAQGNFRILLVGIFCCNIEGTLMRWQRIMLDKQIWGRRDFADNMGGGGDVKDDDKFFWRRPCLYFEDGHPPCYGR